MHPTFYYLMTALLALDTLGLLVAMWQSIQPTTNNRYTSRLRKGQ